jgi:hypothetical protein
VVPRNRDENPARRRCGPKPAPRRHRFRDDRSRHFRLVPSTAEAVERSSFDWVKLESNAEAKDLHVTAAHGRQTPKRWCLTQLTAATG